MSVYVLTDVWKESKASGSALLLLVAIADQATHEGWSWPSRETLAKQIRMDERSVQRLVGELERSGELWVDRSGNAAKKTNRYRILLGGRTSPLPENGRQVVSPPENGRQTVQERETNRAGTGDTPVSQNKTLPVNGTTYVTPPNPPKGEPAGEPEPDTVPLKKKRPPLRVAWPADFALTEERRAVAVKAGIRPDRIEAVWEEFHDKALANGYRKADWDATWRNWVKSPFQDRDRPAASVSDPGAEPPADDLEGRLRWLRDTDDRRFYGSAGLDRRWSEIAEVKRLMGGAS